MLTNHVKVSKQGAFYGLLIQKRFADRFLSGKILEIRKRPVNFLSSGGCIVLVSCQHGRREAMAILQFQKCFQIPLGSMDSFQPLHCLSNEEIDTFKSKAKEQGFLWAWQFSMFHAFSSPLRLPTTAAEVWVTFTLADVRKAWWICCLY